MRICSTPTRYGPLFPSRRAPPTIGTALPFSRPIRRLKKSVGQLGVAEIAALDAEREELRPSTKNSRFSGNSSVEPRQVDLLLVVFDLREIGVVGEVGDDSFCVTPHFTSAPNSPSPWLEMAGVAVRLVIDDPRA